MHILTDMLIDGYEGVSNYSIRHGVHGPIPGYVSMYKVGPEMRNRDQCNIGWS